MGWLSSVMTYLGEMLGMQKTSRPTVLCEWLYESTSPAKVQHAGIDATRDILAWMSREKQRVKPTKPTATDRDVSAPSPMPGSQSLGPKLALGPRPLLALHLAVDSVLSGVLPESCYVYECADLCARRRYVCKAPHIVPVCCKHPWQPLATATGKHLSYVVVLI